MGVFVGLRLLAGAVVVSPFLGLPLDDAPIVGLVVKDKSFVVAFKLVEVLTIVNILPLQEMDDS